jgi:tetratricopeptide (TPR) repeat protein
VSAVAPPSQTIAQLNQQANAHWRAGEMEQAITVFSQIVSLAPRDAVAEHNLASVLGDVGRWAEAEPHLQQAFRKGLDKPETWLVHGRCMLGLRRLSEAEQSFRQAIKRRPLYADAHRDLAQLIWMRDGDAGAAVAEIDKALSAQPGDPALLRVKAQAYEYAGRPEEAADVHFQLAASHPSEHGRAASATFGAIRRGQYTDALAHAENAARLAPNDPSMQAALIEILLALGDAERAANIAAEQMSRSPLDQNAIARLATAWRLLGDARYAQLYDYKTFVSRSMLDVPNGWADLPSYIAELAVALNAVHAFKEHPFNQSLRHGSQAPDILQQPHPAIRALPQALDGPIKRRLAELGGGSDPVRSRNTGNYAFNGMWSVKLHPNGYHANHVHPQGWLSSACYLETVKDSGHEGWIKFGEPGFATSPALSPEHFEKPEPGLLVLFPSYMWHGTVPFSGDQTRLTFAFDLVPAPA